MIPAHRQCIHESHPSHPIMGDPSSGFKHWGQMYKSAATFRAGFGYGSGVIVDTVVGLEEVMIRAPPLC